MFKLQTEVSRLKADVQRLGTERDTAEHRQKIADTNDRLKSSAKSIGDRLKAAALRNNTPQIQKILSNFQVFLHHCPPFFLHSGVQCCYALKGYAIEPPLDRLGRNGCKHCTAACEGLV